MILPTWPMKPTRCEMDAEEIVRALAASDPGFEGLPAGGYVQCALCGAFLENTRYPPGQPPEPFSEPHAPDCPWQLAKEWEAR